MEAWFEAEPSRPEDVPAADWLRWEQEKHQRLLAADTRHPDHEKTRMSDHRRSAPTHDFKVADLSLAEFGRKEIRLAEHEMPGLMSDPRGVRRRAAAQGRADHRARCT